MKLFKTTDKPMQVVEICREQFDFVLPSLQLHRWRRNFVSSQVTTDLVKFCILYCILLPTFGELKFLICCVDLLLSRSFIHQ